MVRIDLKLGVLILCLIASCGPMAFAADRVALAQKPPVTASQRLLSTIERDLKTFVETAVLIEVAAPKLPEAQRIKVFDLHSRAQRSVRVLQLQHASRGLLTEQQIELLFVDEYRRFVDGLRMLHRALVLNQDIADPLGTSLESARKTLLLLEQGRI